MNTRLILSIVGFIVGLLFIIRYRTSDVVEGFDALGSNCPNLLIKKGNAYFLYNKKKAEIPGVNPIQFKHLEEYTEFMQWMRSQGVRCPVLYLEQTYDTQGQRTYRVLPDATEKHAGLPPVAGAPSTIDKMYDAGHNRGSMPGFDPDNQYVGLNTGLDAMFHSDEAVSDSPLDVNWGGVEHTWESVESGKYDGSKIMVKR